MPNGQALTGPEGVRVEGGVRAINGGEVDYIRKTYDVPAKRGGRICFNPWGNPREGTIVGSRYGHLRVRFDGENRVALIHPTFSVTYL